MKMKKVTKSALAGSVLATAVVGLNPFMANAMPQGYNNTSAKCDVETDKSCQATKKTDAKCGEGKCGGSH